MKRRRKKSIGSGWVVSVAAVVVVLMITALYFIFNEVDNPEPKTETEPPVTAVQVDDYNDDYNEQIDQLLEEMELSDKIYQMMFVAPEAITGVTAVTRAGDATRQAIEAYPVGGIVYAVRNFVDSDQTAGMISNSQDYSAIPMFIANSAAEDDTKDILGSGWSTLGFNVSLAPVADAEDGTFGADTVFVADDAELEMPDLTKNVVALDMSALSDEYSIEEAAQKAIESGADMLLKPSDAEAACKAIKEAVKNGEIEEERIDESVRKILKLKLENGIITE